MKYYAVAELTITDQSWVNEYVQNVTKIVEKRGGKYLARTSNIEKVEGERDKPQVVVVIEWPSRDAALSFYESEEYRPYLQKRLAGSKGEFVLIAGDDIAKLAKMAD